MRCCVTGRDVEALPANVDVAFMPRSSAARKLEEQAERESRDAPQHLTRIIRTSLAAAIISNAPGREYLYKRAVLAHFARLGDPFWILSSPPGSP
jgi:hypothetical protein